MCVRARVFLMHTCLMHQVVGDTLVHAELFYQEEKPKTHDPNTIRPVTEETP